MTVDGGGSLQAGSATITGTGSVKQIDLGVVAAEQNLGNEKELTPTAKLTFAKWVLFFIFVLAVLSGIARIWAEKEAGKDIFDAATTLLLPVVTLVLGFYFGRNDNNNPAG